MNGLGRSRTASLIGVLVVVSCFAGLLESVDAGKKHSYNDGEKIILWANKGSYSWKEREAGSEREREREREEHSQVSSVFVSSFFLLLDFYLQHVYA